MRAPIYYCNGCGEVSDEMDSTDDNEALQCSACGSDDIYRITALTLDDDGGVITL